MVRNQSIKIKSGSLIETINDYLPMLICLVQTHLQKKEEFGMPGYIQICHNDKSRNSGGIMLAIK